MLEEEHRKLRKLGGNKILASEKGQKIPGGFIEAVTSAGCHQTLNNLKTSKHMVCLEMK